MESRSRTTTLMSPSNSSVVAAAVSAAGSSELVYSSLPPATAAATSIKVGMVSLGCAKNLVDAEIMLGSVLAEGMQITSCADEADVLVINTCAFIDSAKEESIEAILEAHQQRSLSKRRNQKLIVSGCMSQRFARELRHELPEVDAFIGLDQVSQLGEIVERILRKHPTPNVQRPMSNADSSAFDVRRSAFGVSVPHSITPSLHYSMLPAPCSLLTSPACPAIPRTDCCNPTRCRTNQPLSQNDYPA
jgi:hypothetical protein